MFEVEIVEESESPPPTSDLSAQSSTENVQKENGNGVSQLQKAEPPAAVERKVVTTPATTPATAGLLHSSSESAIGGVGGVALYSGGGDHLMPHPELFVAQQQQQQQQQQHQQYQYQYPIAGGGGSVAPHGVPAYSTGGGGAGGSSTSQEPVHCIPTTTHLSTITGPLPFPEHYRTAPPLAHQHHPVNPDLYRPLHHHSNSSLTQPMTEPLLTTPTAPSQTSMPSLADVPHADLLARAFMTFIHSLGVVFRDQAFEPLFTSLDNHFGGKPSQTTEMSTGNPPPPSSATASNIGSQESSPRQRQDKMEEDEAALDSMSDEEATRMLTRCETRT